MTGGFLAAAHQHSADPASHWVEIGLFIGLLASIAPGWLRLVAGLIDVILLGWWGHLVHAGKVSVAGVSVPWLLIVIAAGILGLYFGRFRGLRHLGEHEFRTRSGYIKGVSKLLAMAAPAG